jgi:CheY-like chemotaxis protein
MPGKRIVVVDDDPKVLELIEWTLRPPEFQVLSFVDPRDALAKLAGLHPDLIICDMMMPDMDGRVFLKIVKRAEALKDVPFLFLTAVRVGAEVQAAFEAGAAAFLVKPFPVARLVRTIRDVLDASKPAAAPPPAKVAARGPRAAPARPETRPSARRAERDQLQEPTDDDFTQMVAVAPRAVEPAPVPGVAAPVEPPPPAAAAQRAALERAPSPEAAPEPEPLPLEASDGVPSAAPPLERPPIAIEGRFSTVQLDGTRVQVMTEAESRPNFVITTVVSHDGQGIRRIETAWSHPLKRHEDLDIVRRQIDLQHERALDEIRRGPLQGPRRRTVWERDKNQQSG